MSCEALGKRLRDMEGGSAAASIKAGVIPPGSFSGNPKKATVTFSTPMLDTTYVIGIQGGNSRSFTFESITINGFVINSNANQALTQDVHWRVSEASNP